MKILLLSLFCSFTVISQTITRGPYLQQATPNSIIIKWQTNTATNSK